MGERVCSYHDVSLRQSDVRTLCEGGWLSDAVVSFFFEHLRHEELAALSRRVLLVPPDMTMLLCCLPPTQARAALGDLDAASRDLVVAAVNDSEARDNKTASGTHWSTLVVFRGGLWSRVLRAAGYDDRDGASEDVFCAVHCDSHAPSNASAAAQVAEGLRHLLCDTGGAAHALPVLEARVPQQQNCSDCGVFVLAFTRRLCALLAQSLDGAPPPPREGAGQRGAHGALLAMVEAALAEVDSSMSGLRREVLQLVEQQS